MSPGLKLSPIVLAIGERVALAQSIVRDVVELLPVTPTKDQISLVTVGLNVLTIPSLVVICAIALKARWLLPIFSNLKSKSCKLGTVTPVPNCTKIVLLLVVFKLN